MKVASSFLLVAILLLFTSPVQAGPGHDHGDGAPATSAGPASPRFSVVTDLFEVVGQKTDKGLVVFVDRFATNEPVLNAKVSIELGSTKLDGAFQADTGTYLFPREPFTKPDTYALVINVAAGDDIDILAGNLVIPENTNSDAHSHAPPLWMMIVGGVVAIIAIVLFFGLRRRRATSAAKTWGGAHA
jgi:hypothetical protein